MAKKEHQTNKLEILKLEVENKKLLDLIDELKDIFWDDGYSHSGKELIKEINLAKETGAMESGRRLEADERRERVINMINDENSRLWYLLRAVMGDRTLKGETVNHQKEINMEKLCRSPYSTPRF